MYCLIYFFPIKINILYKVFFKKKENLILNSIIKCIIIFKVYVYMYVYIY